MQKSHMLAGAFSARHIQCFPMTPAAILVICSMRRLQDSLMCNCSRKARSRQAEMWLGAAPGQLAAG